MAHADQFDFVRLVKEHFPHRFIGGRVLEIGSLDINGSVRSFFKADTYVGVDVADGPGVDEACQGQLVGYPSETFDVVISCECMEHNPYWIETISNMFRMVKPGGLVIISCATTGRMEHGTSRTSTAVDSPLSISIGWEYYRNLAPTDLLRLNMDFWCEKYSLLQNWNSFDMYFVGVKKPSISGNEIENLDRSLRERFRSTASAEILGRLFGEAGVKKLRKFWRNLRGRQ